MKNIWFPLTLVFFSAQFSTAQVDGAKLVESAGTALASFHSDPVNNSAKLEEAIHLIEQSLANPEVQALASAWLTKGNIYITRLHSDLEKRQMDPNTPLTGDNDALVAFEAYKKVYSLSQSPDEKLEVLPGISEVQGHLVNIGMVKYEEMEYEKSFLSFQASLESHELLKENGHTSMLDDLQQLEGQIYLTGIAASQANRCPDAMVYFEKLYHSGTDRPTVYEALYYCKQASGDESGAGSILSEGREKFPNDSGLLFAEINLYLKDGRLNELIARLEQAIELEPNNVRLYVTLGNVYDNLSQIGSQNNNEPNENGYFEQAKKYYSQGLLIDPQNLDANFSLGSLYYNKAALRSQQMNGLPEDFSKKGLEKLNVLQNEIMGLFDQSLPYFKKAESIDPNDINTLIALSEIYARKEDMVISEEMKRRLDIVRGGGKNPSPYFHFPN